jgi:hypothetical protein
MDIKITMETHYALFTQLPVNGFWKIFESVSFDDVMCHLYTQGRWGTKWFLLENFNDQKYYFENDTFLQGASVLEFGSGKALSVTHCNGLFTDVRCRFTDTECESYMAKKNKREKGEDKEPTNKAEPKKNKYKSCG